MGVFSVWLMSWTKGIRPFKLEDAPDIYPTVWVCMCTKKCMGFYDITDKNTTPMNDHLTNAHNLEKKMGHVKKATLSAHQAQLQKQEA